MPQYAGPIISVSAGDEVAMNSMVLSIVSIDGSGNGEGLIKVPMMDRVKLGVSLSGIQVAEGGCIVAGRAELSGVEASLLNDKQRAELAKIYAEFNKAIDLAVANADVIAKTYNTFSEKLGGIKEQAATLLSNNNPSKQKEVAALTSATTDQMQASLNAMRVAYGAKINQEMAANLEKMIADNRAQVAVLSNPAATPEAVATASQALAATNPAEVEKTIKSLGPLQVEYNGKLYGDGKTLKMNPESLEGIIQGQSDIPLSCGFFLKNGISGEAISWELKTSSGAALPLEAPLRISATSNSEYLGIKWPDGQAKLTLTATSGSRKVTLSLEKPVWNLSDLQVADGNRIAKAGEILYLVKAPAKDEKATVSWKSDVEPSLLKNYFYVDGKNPTSSFNSNKITYSFSESPNTTTYRMNALGYDKTVKVQVVNQNRHDADFMPPGVNALLTKTYTAVEGGMKQVEKVVNIFDDKIKVKVLPLKINGSMYNKEHDNNRHYLEVLDGSISGGFDLKSGEKVVYPPILSILNISINKEQLTQCGLYGKFSLELPIAGGALQETVFETKAKTIKKPFYIKGGAKGCIEAGLKFENVKGKQYIDADVRGFGKGCLSGSLSYNSKDGLFGEVVLDPVIVGVNAVIKSKGFIEFELVDWTYSYSLTKELVIWSSKK